MSDETRVFKLWKCPLCGESFNHWVTPEEEQKGSIICPYCYGEININRGK